MFAGLFRLEFGDEFMELFVYEFVLYKIHYLLINNIPELF